MNYEFHNYSFLNIYFEICLKTYLSPSCDLTCHLDLRVAKYSHFSDITLLIFMLACLK